MRWARRTNHLQSNTAPAERQRFPPFPFNSPEIVKTDRQPARDPNDRSLEIVWEKWIWIFKRTQLDVLFDGSRNSRWIDTNPAFGGRTMDIFIQWDSLP